MGKRGKDNTRAAKYLLLFGGIVLLVPALVLGINYMGGGKKEANTEQLKPAGNNDQVSRLTGEVVTRDIRDRRPIAVMVENYWEARPQSGLDKADVVYEVEAEGGITRFVAIFQSQDAAEIGPVRSVRPYFVSLVNAYNPLYAHVGGSSEGLQTIKNLQIADIDEMYLGTQVFWRSADRKAPHNTYTGTDKIRQYAKGKGLDKPVEFTGFRFLQKGEENQDGKDAKKVSINFPARENVVHYVYDPAAKLYNRSHQSPHMDKVTGKQLTARNILIQFASHQPTGPGAQTLKVGVVGEGKAMLVSQGKIYFGKWSRQSDRDGTIFTDDNGQEFKLAPGQTWVEIVRPETNIDVQ